MAGAWAGAAASNWKGGFPTLQVLLYRLLRIGTPPEVASNDQMLSVMDSAVSGTK